MIEDSLDVQVVCIDGCALVAVTGEIDLATYDTFVDRVSQAVYRAARTVEIDLTGVTFFGSEGIRALLEVLALGTELGVRVKVSAASESIRRVLRLVSLDEAFGLA